MPDSIQDLGGPIQALYTALKARDAYTAQHSDRTTQLARALGKSCGLDGRQLDILTMGAALHDIGKIGVPDAVLLKPGALDEDEWELMKQHSDTGAQIITAMNIEPMDEVALAVRHHHEGYDGLGYPDGLAGENIPFLSRVIALADSYDAMATRRPYKQPREHAEIMEILQGSACTHYDPWMLGKFVQLIESSPYRADRYTVDA
jgi:HD-GYP domain-containing protein (c-di-GMP phosphodiesterase class II)